ncbi:DUF2188 domain-containing protein [uncultured Paracoccus sp.]|uniref:DUF2188 domain-containing protein n=1 Tax=Paracoccus sp. M683 TaxID=2594268 RepID=UPI00163DCF37
MLRYRRSRPLPRSRVPFAAPKVVIVLDSPAIDYGRSIAQNQGSELRIQNRGGQFREAWSHGNDRIHRKVEP